MLEDFSCIYNLYVLLISNMKSEKFNLKWHTFTDHLREMLCSMMSSNELTDVTLVSEDKKQFKAHKAILSASSLAFKSIINLENLSIQIIYLKDIQSLEVETILNFIYLGEATIYQDRLDEFLNVAKSLEINEISKVMNSLENTQFINLSFILWSKRTTSFTFQNFAY